VVGVIGSAFGVLGGIGLSVSLTALLNGLGIDVPNTGVVVPVSAIVNTMLVGLVVTLCSAWLPARRSGKIPPLAAMRATAIEVPQVGRTRTRAGIGVLLLGLGAVAGVILGAPTVFLGIGILFVFGGTIVLGPVIAPGIGKLIGTPVARFRGVAGVMARQNSVRNPKRAARTASPVLIGVALVTAVSALAASIRGQVNDIFTEQFKGDYAVSVEARGFGGLSPALAVELNEIDGVDRATGIGIMLAEIDGAGRSLTVITPETIEGNYDIGLIGAQYSDLDAGGIFLAQDWSVQQDKPVGSTITLTLADSTERALRVRGLYRNAELVGSRVVSRSLLEGANVQSFDLGVYVKLAAGADDNEVRARLQQAVSAYGQGKLLSKQEYIDEQAGSVNQLLGLIYGLLLLSVIISIVGIVITMLLSVYERRREIGLLRAVGMTKRQVRTTVRWESVITALFGAVMGIALGVGLGWAVVFSLSDQGLTSFEVPIGTTAFIMCMSFFVGVFAAVYPAWRATRTPVLDALVTT
jgi:putative ABC transport system permease protein